jgi:hypothetical protein
MKYLVLSVLSVVILTSCGVKKPLTNAIKEEYNLNESNIRQVQFFVSSEIVLEQTSKKGTSGTTNDGTLVSSNSNEKNRILILPRTKCIFEEYGPNKEVIIRFETGQGRTLRFATRPNMDNGKFYLLADWEQNKGGKIEYGNEIYYATPSSGSAHLMVKVKNSQRTKRKDRVVKGMKV